MRQTAFSGACAIGEVDRPAIESTLMGATRIAQGTLFATPWIFEAMAEHCPPRPNDSIRYANRFQLVGANGVSCGGAGGNSSPNAALIEVDNLSNGQRLACGYVPPTITSVSAFARSGPGVTQKVFAKELGTKRYFALSLGKIGAACYYVCHGSLTFKFYVGSKIVSTQVMNPGSVISSGLSFVLQPSDASSQ